MTRTLNVLVPGTSHRTVVWRLEVLTVCGSASGPKFHSYRMIVDVAPDTLALTMTLVFTVALFGAVMVTEGGWAGRIVIPVDTRSLHPDASEAVADTVKVPSSR